MSVWRAPGPERRRQLMLLGGLVVVLALVLWFRFGPATAPTDVSATAPQAAGPAVATSLPEAVRLETLETVPALSDGRRNPFSFGARSVPTPAMQPVATTPYTPAPIRPTEPQGPPPILLRLTGLTVLPGREQPMVTLSNPTTHGLYQAFEGDIVDGRYLIVKVGLQSVVVSYLDGSGARTLALGR